MRFSTGVLDSLFGQRVTVTLAGPNGEPITKTVTKQWLERLKASGLATPLGAGLVPVHMLGLDGYVRKHWKLGKDLDEETWRRFRDPKSGAVYAMTLLQAGQPETHLVPYAQWLELKRQLDAVDQE